LQEGTGAPNAFLGDLYTVGSPRVGAKDFATAFKNALAKGEGNSWRTVNQKDAVTMVPVTINPFEKNPFTHVDVGKRIFADKAPENIDTEIKAATVSAFGILPSFSSHSE
jgi:hypothetical protein